MSVVLVKGDNKLLAAFISFIVELNDTEFMLVRVSDEYLRTESIKTDASLVTKYIVLSPYIVNPTGFKVDCWNEFKV